jgi:hypothetical protein
MQPSLHEEPAAAALTTPSAAAPYHSWCAMFPTYSGSKFVHLWFQLEAEEKMAQVEEEMAQVEVEMEVEAQVQLEVEEEVAMEVEREVAATFQ